MLKQEERVSNEIREVIRGSLRRSTESALIIDNQGFVRNEGPVPVNAFKVIRIL